MIQILQMLLARDYRATVTFYSTSCSPRAASTAATS